MNDFSNAEGRVLVDHMVAAIHENAAELSALDGLLGDGDHGINMDKGFALAASRLSGRDGTLSEGLQVLGTTLLDEIGGAMGPLYGSFFLAMAGASQGLERIDASAFGRMLKQGLAAVLDLGSAQVGDKTLVDTLVPAVEAFETQRTQGAGFVNALTACVLAAEKGRDSTRNLVAKKGRASRLGERSRGVLDAGSVSCFLLLRAMSRAAVGVLNR